MEQKDYVINQLAIAKVQLEVNILELKFQVKDLQQKLEKERSKENASK